jgi:hypothetical protein
MYENIIKNIECNLSYESKSILYKKYNKLFNNINDNNKNTVPKKIVDTNLNDDINKVVYLTSEFRDKTPEGDVMDDLGLKKMCCRRHMLSHVDIE